MELIHIPVNVVQASMVLSVCKVGNHFLVTIYILMYIHIYLVKNKNKISNAKCYIITSICVFVEHVTHISYISQYTNNNKHIFQTSTNV